MNFNFSHVVGKGGFGKVKTLTFHQALIELFVLLVGLEGRNEKDQANLCHERDVEGKVTLKLQFIGKSDSWMT